MYLDHLVFDQKNHHFFLRYKNGEFQTLKRVKSLKMIFEFLIRHIEHYFAVNKY